MCSCPGSFLKSGFITLQGTAHVRAADFKIQFHEASEALCFSCCILDAAGEVLNLRAVPGLPADLAFSCSAEAVVVHGVQLSAWQPGCYDHASLLANPWPCDSGADAFGARECLSKA